MGLISGMVMGVVVGVALMAGWSRVMRRRSRKRIAKAADIKVLGSLGRDDLKKLCGDNFPEWISFPQFEQGIQFIVDDSGGFSSVAAQYLENIADDYTNTPVLLYCVRDPVTHVSSKNRKESITRSLHDAVSFSKLSSFCNLMVPIGLPSLSRTYI